MWGVWKLVLAMVGGVDFLNVASKISYTIYTFPIQLAVISSKPGGGTFSGG